MHISRCDELLLSCWVQLKIPTYLCIFARSAFHVCRTINYTGSTSLDVQSIPSMNIALARNVLHTKS